MRATIAPVYKTEYRMMIDHAKPNCLLLISDAHMKGVAGSNKITGTALKKHSGKAEKHVEQLTFSITI